MKFALPNGV